MTFAIQHRTELPQLRLSPDVALKKKSITDEGHFSGYGSVFGVKDSYGDVVVPGAFKSSLAEHKKGDTLPAMLWQHRADHPIGVYSAMKEDDHGLHVEGMLALNTQKGREAHALLKAGALNGLSIGFMPKTWEYDEENETTSLTAVDLWEVSVVTFPACGSARVADVKSIGDLESLAEIERYLRDACGFTRHQATAIVAKCQAIGAAHRDDAAMMSEVEKTASRISRLLST